MESTAKAIYSFFSSFGLPAYDTNAVPDEAEFPHIIYSISEPEWDKKASGYLLALYRTASKAAVNKKADEIAAALGTKPRLECEGGIIQLWPENPFVQPYKDGDILGAYIHFTINAYHMPGM